MPWPARQSLPRPLLTAHCPLPCCLPAPVRPLSPALSAWPLNGHSMCLSNLPFAMIIMSYGRYIDAPRLPVTAERTDNPGQLGSRTDNPEREREMDSIVVSPKPYPLLSVRLPACLLFDSMLYVGPTHPTPWPSRVCAVT